MFKSFYLILLVDTVIECNDFAQAIPKIDLQEIRSLQELISYVPASMKGRLLLYDIDKNNELIQERYNSNTNELPLQISKPSAQQKTLILKREPIKFKVDKRK